MKGGRIPGWVWAIPAAAVGIVLGITIGRSPEGVSVTACETFPQEVAVWLATARAREAAFEAWGEAVMEAARREVEMSGDDGPFAVLRASETIEGLGADDMLANLHPDVGAAIVEHEGRIVLEQQARREMFAVLDGELACYRCEAVNVVRAGTLTPDVDADGMIARRALREAAVACWPDLEDVSS